MHRGRQQLRPCDTLLSSDTLFQDDGHSLYHLLILCVRYCNTNPCECGTHYNTIKKGIRKTVAAPLFMLLQRSAYATLAAALLVIAFLALARANEIHGVFAVSKSSFTVSVKFKSWNISSVIIRNSRNASTQIICESVPYLYDGFEEIVVPRDERCLRPALLQHGLTLDRVMTSGEQDVLDIYLQSENAGAKEDLLVSIPSCSPPTGLYASNISDVSREVNVSVAFMSDKATVRLSSKKSLLPFAVRCTQAYDFDGFSILLDTSSKCLSRELEVHGVKVNGSMPYSSASNSIMFTAIVGYVDPRSETVRLTFQPIVLSGMYGVSAVVAGYSVSASVTVLDETHLKFHVEAGGEIIDCPNEEYAFDGSSEITLPGLESSSDCIAAAIANYPVEIGGLFYNPDTSGVDVHAVVEHIPVVVKLLPEK